MLRTVRGRAPLHQLVHLTAVVAEQYAQPIQGSLFKILMRVELELYPQRQLVDELFEYAAQLSRCVGTRD